MNDTEFRAAFERLVEHCNKHEYSRSAEIIRLAFAEGSGSKDVSWHLLDAARAKDLRTYVDGRAAGYPLPYLGETVVDDGPSI
jgi:hypothetical protein